MQLQQEQFTPNDIDGNRIFSLPKDNFSVSIENLSCRGSSNGSIAVSAVDENLNFFSSISFICLDNLFGNQISSSSKKARNLPFAFEDPIFINELEVITLLAK